MNDRFKSITVENGTTTVTIGDGQREVVFRAKGQCKVLDISNEYGIPHAALVSFAKEVDYMPEGIIILHSDRPDRLEDDVLRAIVTHCEIGDEEMLDLVIGKAITHGVGGIRDEVAARFSGRANYLRIAQPTDCQHAFADGAFTRTTRNVEEG